MSSSDCVELGLSIGIAAVAFVFGSLFGIAATMWLGAPERNEAPVEAALQLHNAGMDPTVGLSQAGRGDDPFKTVRIPEPIPTGSLPMGHAAGAQFFGDECMGVGPDPFYGMADEFGFLSQIDVGGEALNNELAHDHILY